MALREQIEVTAYHEAGHAVMALSTGFLVTEISCQASDSGYGHTAWKMPVPMTKASRVGAVLTLASGMAADYVHWSSLPHKDEQELSMGHGSDRSGARVHLDALGQGDVFDGYLGLAILHLRKFEVWHHVVIFAEMLMAVGLINGQEILLRASQSVPRLSVQELERFMRVVELQHDQSIA